MSYTTKQWNELVWILNFRDHKIEELFKEKRITKKKYREYKSIMNKAWIKIWEVHPDQHPELTKFFKKNFE